MAGVDLNTHEVVLKQAQGFGLLD